MTPENILEYIRDNPDFLESKGLTLTEKPQDNADTGNLSITERQLASLRERNGKLEAQIEEMIRVGHENDEIGERMHRIAVAFFLCDSLATTLALMQQILLNDFQVPAVAVRIWATPDESGQETQAALSPVPNHIRQYADLLDTPYCGREVSPEIRSWFEHGDALQSFAFLPLRTTQTFGIMALASDDETRFHAAMGTLYLTRLSELASMALARFLDA
jgi:uncharacterized protein YigA (DUF484 family)